MRARLQHRYSVGVNTPKRYRQLRVKDLPKVPTWRLKWDSNLRLSRCKAPNLPLRHHALCVNHQRSIYIWRLSALVNVEKTVDAKNQFKSSCRCFKFKHNCSTLSLTEATASEDFSSVQHQLEAWSRSSHKARFNLRFN